MHIEFRYGQEQRFRRRYEDITVGGKVLAAQMPIRRATWCLNGGSRVPLYVESVPDVILRAGRGGGWFTSPIDWRLSYKDSPAGLRLKELGDFTVEIPVSTVELRTGRNTMTVEVEDHGKMIDRATVEFAWDPRPVELPIHLDDLTGVAGIQDIAQVVDGYFIIDAEANAIVTRAPVAPDALALLAGPAGSQEATFEIICDEPSKSKYIGLSDFFVRHEAEDPPIGIKPGWSTAGLATIRFDGEARSWLAFGDNSLRREGWVVFTEPAAEYRMRPAVRYRVRHQAIFRSTVTTSRFRIWPVDETEPESWLCEESDASVDEGLPRHRSASFGLFQHTGGPTRWSDIHVREI